jgi:hypothetical protein
MGATLPVTESDPDRGSAPSSAGSPRGHDRRIHRRLLHRSGTGGPCPRDDYQEFSLSFETSVLGVTVSANRVDITNFDEVGGLRTPSQTIPILELPLPRRGQGLDRGLLSLGEGATRRW